MKGSLPHSCWRFQSIFGWPKAEWNRVQSIQFMVAEQQQNGNRGSQPNRAAEQQFESISLFLFILHSGSPPQPPPYATPIIPGVLRPIIPSLLKPIIPGIMDQVSNSRSPCPMTHEALGEQLDINHNEVLSPRLRKHLICLPDCLCIMCENSEDKEGFCSWFSGKDSSADKQSSKRHRNNVADSAISSMRKE